MNYLFNKIPGCVAAGILSGCLWLFSVPAFAHEFWLLPDQFMVGPDGGVYIRLQVGEHFTGNNWKGDKTNVMQLLLIEPGGRTMNLEPGFGNTKGDSVYLAHVKPGTQMVIFHSAKSYIELSAEDFNNYLKEDGLTEALEYRSRHQELGQPARENYQRCAKTIFYSANPLQTAVTQPTTLPLDIVPVKNLYTVTSGSTIKMRFVVLFKGRPLPNTAIKAWHKQPGGTVDEKEMKTDSKGRLKLDVLTQGTWMISTVKMLHNDGAEVPWQSYWGSLTWGY